MGQCLNRAPRLRNPMLRKSVYGWRLLSIFVFRNWSVVLLCLEEILCVFNFAVMQEDP